MQSLIHSCPVRYGLCHPGDERLALDEELDAARKKVKETGAAIAALTPSVPPITAPAPEAIPDDAPKQRKSYLRG